MNHIKPMLHKEFLIDERVAFDFGDGSSLKGTGTIVGIASMHVIFTYIVLLDRPLNVESFENWKAFTVPGGQLRSLEPKDDPMKLFRKYAYLASDPTRTDAEDREIAELGRLLEAAGMRTPFEPVTRDTHDSWTEDALEKFHRVVDVGRLKEKDTLGDLSRPYGIQYLVTALPDAKLGYSGVRVASSEGEILDLSEEYLLKYCVMR
jgi:hypothetical protein